MPTIASLVTGRCLGDMMLYHNDPCFSSFLNATLKSPKTVALPDYVADSSAPPPPLLPSSPERWPPFAGWVFPGVVLYCPLQSGLSTRPTSIFPQSQPPPTPILAS